MKIIRLVENDIGDAVERVNDKAEAAIPAIEAKEEEQLNFDLDTLEGVLNHALQANLRQLSQNSTDFKPQITNLLIEGPAGVGKSGIIEDWAKARGINLVKITGSELTSELVQGMPFRSEEFSEEYEDLLDEIQYLPDGPEKAKARKQLRGMKKTLSAKLVTLDFFKRLEKEMSVLFIDELNRSPQGVRAAVLDIIQSHAIPDSNSDTNRAYIDNFVMTIAAINPSDDAHVGTHPLDLAMLTRFSKFEWEPAASVTRDYLISLFTNSQKDLKKEIATGINPKRSKYFSDSGKAQAGKFTNKLNTPPEVGIVQYERRKNIVNALFGSADFEFDYDNNLLVAAQENQEAVCNARTLTSLLLECDGTTEEFLKLWPRHCGKNQKMYDQVRTLVADVADIPDPANEVWKDLKNKEQVKLSAEDQDKVNTLVGTTGPSPSDKFNSWMRDPVNSYLRKR